MTTAKGIEMSSEDLWLFNEGRHSRIDRFLGAHLEPGGSTDFAVWAPNARRVSVLGAPNGWGTEDAPLAPQGSSGVWAGRFPDFPPGALYKYRLWPRNGGPPLDKADPVGFRQECPPATASQVWPLAYDWHDARYRAGRSESLYAEPVSIYEVHLGSWRRGADGRWLSYEELAPLLSRWVRAHGFTHVEILPVMEHPFYGSWGYQTTGYFAPTARYGTPTEFMRFIDELHGDGIGVILDWVPSHFPGDAHGLAQFDGTALYEHADPREGFHPDWHTLIFNYGRHEVRSFLLSSARFWLDVYHADALRVDAVASMLYRDYSRAPGEWIPNREGGRENLEAIAWLRQMNAAVYAECPGIATMAEESTAWPGVSAPVHDGGLGFGFKWDMGWMHDTLEYFARDPVHRRHHHGELTFRMVYGFQENFVLPLSHDEVVHGKRALVEKLPGDSWQQLAQLRLLLAYQWLLPGKKLLFMGGEFGQRTEWNHERSLDWHLLERPEHQGVARLVSDLNRLYSAEPSLATTDRSPESFRWVVADDAAHSVYAWLRTSSRGRPVLAVMNAPPVPRSHYQLGVPAGGTWEELLNTDADLYGGSGLGNWGAAASEAAAQGEWPHRLTLTLPPLALLVLAPAAASPGQGSGPPAAR